MGQSLALSAAESLASLEADRATKSREKQTEALVNRASQCSYSGRDVAAFLVAGVMFVVSEPLSSNLGVARLFF